MMKWILSFFLLGFFVVSPGMIHAGKAAKVPASSGGEAELVAGLMPLDPAIVAVRPASVRQPSRPRFATTWNPAITLRAKTPLESQIDIALRSAAYVVSFQGGVPTDDVLGGVLLFIEGEGWEPEVGQVFYRVDSPSSPVEVGIGVRTKGENGNVSCCEDIPKAGRITGSRLQAEPVASILPAVKAVLKDKKGE